MKKQRLVGLSPRPPRRLAALGRSLAALGLAGSLCGVWALPAFGALREPPALTREQVRARLADRAEQMRLRQERHWQRREGAERYRIGPSGRPIIRLPREPRPVPPPESLP